MEQLQEATHSKERKSETLHSLLKDALKVMPEPSKGGEGGTWTVYPDLGLFHEPALAEA